MSPTISANVDGKTATKLKMVASMENRSVSNAVSSAITVFVGLPKGVRGFLARIERAERPRNNYQTWPRNDGSGGEGSP